MQKTLSLIVLLLFLNLLFAGVSVFCFYSDSRNSLVLHCLSTSNLVMAPRIPWKQQNHIAKDLSWP
ncbi:hypothetical protein RchiOBHm_Chr7g0183491 [Rosa chinensis]|uniref:Secreted protein n=1 Tax=Rosa chinensis TaxID=74649 RepID=A0A2P6P396_ROSCH|nr:hypothetical protein RchiOBHm_Chr7g0183491 [Rosa chinensis]